MKKKELSLFANSASETGIYVMAHRQHVVQSKLTITDILYSGQLAVVGRFTWNLPNQAQTLSKKFKKKLLRSREDYIKKAE